MLKLCSFFTKFSNQLVVVKKVNKEYGWCKNIVPKRIWLLFKLTLAMVWFIIYFLWNKCLRYFLEILTKSICNYFIPSKHLLVFKTSSTCLQRNNFSSSKKSWRRLENVLITSRKTSWKRLEDVLKTSWRRLGRRKIVTLKTSSRRLGGKQNFYWWYLYLTNLNVYLTNLCFTNLYLKNL